MALRPRVTDPASAANAPAHQVAAVTAIAHAQGRESTVTALAPTQEIASTNAIVVRGNAAPQSVGVNGSVTTSAPTAGRGSMIGQGRETGSVRGTEKGEAHPKYCFICSYLLGRWIKIDTSCCIYITSITKLTYLIL